MPSLAVTEFRDVSGMRGLLLALVLILPATARAGSSVIFVDAGATGADTGLTWNDAFATLQSALEVAGSGDQIWIAEGSYKPELRSAPGTPRTESFAIPGGVALYGGFAGGEDSLTQRDPVAHPTVLSGDLGTPGLAADNAFHVVSVSEAGSGTRLDGLAVVAGNADGAAVEHQYGAGVKLSGSALTLARCSFADHQSPATGSALYATGAGTQLVIAACAFEGNTSAILISGGQIDVSDSLFANNVGANAVYLSGTLSTFRNTTLEGNAGGFGAVRLISGTVASFRECRFTGNQAGGISAQSTGNTLIEDCRFQGNMTGSSGSALSITQMDGNLAVRRSDFLGNTSSFSGGAIWVQSSRIAVSECRFIANSAAAFGGAVAVNLESLGGLSGSPLTNCTFLGNSAADGGAVSVTGSQAGFMVVGSSPVLINCLISGNAATHGAALYVNANSLPQLINTTVANNIASAQGGGLYLIKAGSFPTPGIPKARLRNCIVWGNSDASGSTQAAPLFRVDGSFDVNRCDVQGWDGSLGGFGNFGNDPQFLDAHGTDGVAGTFDDDLRLISGSPAIDAGDAASLPVDESDLDCDGITAELVPLDVGRVARLDDDPGTPDSGVGSSPLIDLGAWEHSAWTNLGEGLGGSIGKPCLVGFGTLEGGTSVSHSLAGALPQTTAFVFLGVTRLDAPFKHGTLVPFPDVLLTLATGPSGSVSLSSTWPLGLPSGVLFYMQDWILDPAGPVGFAASNAISGITP